MDRKSFAIDYAKKFLRECESQNIPIGKAILFGSFVSGKSHRYSDIDLAIVSERFSENAIENGHLICKANHKFLKIEAHPFEIKYFEEGDPFIDEIKRTGIELEWA
ncbi:MAG: nucleotidyltransferase domain-containing protein [Chitinophagales bacterium]|nr:nucleotidyltransferase domain-containing protein [Chitinophagales bacterium]